MIIILLLGIAITIFGIVVKIREGKDNLEADEGREITATLVKHLSISEYTRYLAQTTQSSFIRDLSEQAANHPDYENEDAAGEWYSVYEYELNGETKTYLGKLPTSEPVGATIKLAVTKKGEVKETSETRNNQSGAYILLIIGLSMLTGYICAMFMPQLLNMRIDNDDRIGIAITSGMFIGLVCGAISILIKIGNSDEVEATVTDIHVEEKYDSDNGYTKTYYPVYTYYYNGKNHTTKSNGSSNKQIGDKQIIYIYKDGKIYEKRIAYFLFAAAAFMGVIMFFLFFIG